MLPCKRREAKRRIPIKMSTEKNSEKVALYVALVASILALVLTIFTYLVPPSGNLLAGLMPEKAAPVSSRGPGGGRAPGGPGRMMRGFAPSPEYVQKYEERVRQLQTLSDEIKMRHKAAGAVLGEVLAAQARLVDAKLNLMRLKKGQRIQTNSFANSCIDLKNAEQQLQLAEVKFKAGGTTMEELTRLRLAVNEMELRILEAERRLNPEKVAEAKALLQKTPLDKLTDQDLEKLLAAEQRFRGPR